MAKDIYEIEVNRCHPQETAPLGQFLFVLPKK